MVHSWTEWSPPSKPKPREYTLNRKPQCIICGAERKQSELSSGRCRFCIPHVHVNHVPKYQRGGNHNPYD